MDLFDLTIGEKALIRHLEGGRGLMSRLAALGFTPGATLTLVRREDHGPLLVNIRGGRVALGREEAAAIQIMPAPKKAWVETKVRPSTNARIALVGQPNVGKSTVFNALTGLNQHVGNWTGKTIDQKSGLFNVRDLSCQLIDLPGTYSLTANSEEERITRDFIIKEKPDLIIAVVDAANLERNLYLVAELLLLPAPVLLVLNMMDVAELEGIHIEPHVLESALGIPVVPMVVTRAQGIRELQETVYRMMNQEVDYNPRRPSILPAHKEVLDRLISMIESRVPAPYPVDWVALKLLEGDEQLTTMMHGLFTEQEWKPVHDLLYEHEDAILDIAGARYEWIARLIRAAVVEPKVTRLGFTSRIDKVLIHPLYGTLFLVALLGGVFWLTYSVGSPLQGLLNDWVTMLADYLRGVWVSGPHWLVEFVAGGILGGIGLVLTFVPILAIFFAILGLMEDTGYMARAAYLTDRWMHLMGLHGKSFLPILLGFGCNVPGILGTRIIESKRARLLTAILVPLVPCTGRMAVITILSAAFFPQNAFWVTWGLVGGSIIVLAVLGISLHHFFFEDEHVPFIMELPLYHLPNARTIGLYVRENLMGFVEKAGTTILAASLIVWALSYFPNGDVQTSFLSILGRAIEPLGLLIGLPWPALVALLSSLVAKENTIATLGVLYGGLANFSTGLSAPAALAFLVFQTFFIPCVGTVAALYQETKSLRWTGLSLGLMLFLSSTLAFVVYRIGSAF